MKERRSTDGAGTPAGAVVLGLLTALLGGGCRGAPRCATCGMKIDPSSAWVSYVNIGGREIAFDTPRCALTAWRGAHGEARDARFREYYSQELKNAGELRFVAGGDVVGPMGPDLVPVAAEKSGRFARDHNGAPPKSADELLREGVP